MHHTLFINQKTQQHTKPWYSFSSYKGYASSKSICNSTTCMVWSCKQLCNNCKKPYADDALAKQCIAWANHTNFCMVHWSCAAACSWIGWKAPCCCWQYAVMPQHDVNIVSSAWRLYYIGPIQWSQYAVILRTQARFIRMLYTSTQTQAYMKQDIFSSNCTPTQYVVHMRLTSNTLCCFCFLPKC